MNGKNITYGLLGEKLGHSFSPLIHKRLGDYPYELIEVPSDKIDEFFEKREFSAINVTIPYKKNALAACDHVSDLARRIGAVNAVIKMPDGTLSGDNTDAYGFAYMLKQADIDVSGKKCMIFGTGGASVMAQVVLADLGASSVVTVAIEDNNDEYLAPHYNDTEVIINCTPMGMYPKNGASAVELEKFTKVCAVADLVYNPWRTKLILDAEARGIKSASGLSMLVAQAFRAYELFFNTKGDPAKIKTITDEIFAATCNIVLVGMPGCGKSTVARILAMKTGRELIDIDAKIVEREGCSIPEIFERGGESEFRRIESEVLEEYTKLSGKIIATGGGAVTIAKNIPLLRQNSKVFYIKRTLSDLATDGRPLSASGKLEEMYARRAPMYESVCDHEIAFESSMQVAVDILKNMNITDNGKKLKLLLINGPNLNLLGLREPDIYGKRNFAALLDYCKDVAERYGITLECYQSNHEGDIVDKIQAAYGCFDGLVINPAAYTHTSVAILDAIKAVSIPTVEVHLSDINSRDEFRKFSYVSLAAKKTICGKGFDGYREAIEWFVCNL